jgi:catechol 2,3-dioxygenase-like lactoylglutathione lyase family enzyme
VTSCFNGIHHLALYTTDLDVTLRFYREIVGLETSEVADSPRGRHAFVHLEPHEQGRPGLHIWENPALDTPDPVANRGRVNSGPGVMAHLALYLPDADAEQVLRQNLTAHDVEIVEFDRLGTFAFWDPNGIMVEIVPPRFDELQATQPGN